MKKIYLEKQFMKATNLNNYIIGEITSHSKESGEYQIKKEDGSIITVFAHSILGWEEYKDGKEVGYRFHYHAKMIREKEMFICDIYKNGDFFYRYTYGFDECSVLNTSDSFRYFLLVKQGNEVEREFDDSWNEFRDKVAQKERPNRAFTPEKLDKITYTTTPPQSQGKTIYTIDMCRCSDGTNITAFTVSNIMKDGTVAILFTDTLKGNYRELAKFILDFIQDDIKRNKSVSEAELRVNVSGLGIGLLDYLEDCPIPVKLLHQTDIRASHSLFIERVEGEKLLIHDGARLRQLMENLDLGDDKNIAPYLKLNKPVEGQIALLGSLILACYEGGTFFCKDKFDIYIKHSEVLFKSSTLEYKEDTYTLMLKNNETGEEVNMTSSSNLQEVEKMKHILAHSFQMAGVQFKVKE